MIVENGGRGILVSGGASPRIRYNTIDLNGGNGLDFNGSDNDADSLIENNLITRNGGRGWIYGGAVTRGYNNVWGNGTDYYGAGTIPDSHLSSDPRYVDPDNRNWLLRTGSPSLTAGSDGGQIGRYGGLPDFDFDFDGIPDFIDPDDDNDGVSDEEDLFPLDPNEWIDTDGDGIGNNADRDDDNDGVRDGQDAFPLDPNESADGDGVGDNTDNCPDVPNPSQADTDGGRCSEVNQAE
ncbi:MAG: hypothetical protein C1943_00390 [Halochromatium sp.]|nr:hypothetical protein [Halochromatium sp.]